MIENNKLFFQTYDAFNAALQDSQIKDGAIVFIADQRLIWTHGVLFDGKVGVDPSILDVIRLINEELEDDSAMTAVLEAISKKADTTALNRKVAEIRELLQDKADLDDLPLLDIIDIKSNVLSLQNQLLDLQTEVTSINSAIGADVSAVALKFADINNFLNQIEETGLNSIISAVSTERDRAIAVERDLQSQITQVSLGYSDGIRHRILSASEYEALDSYDKDTLYFVTEYAIEDNEYGHHLFGGTFPLVLGWGFGNEFPVYLN